MVPTPLLSVGMPAFPLYRNQTGLIAISTFKPSLNGETFVFKRASDAEVDQSWYYFRMADYDFNLMPVYHSVKDYIAKHNN